MNHESHTDATTKIKVKIILIVNFYTRITPRRQRAFYGGVSRVVPRPTNKQHQNQSASCALRVKRGLTSEARQRKKPIKEKLI